MQAAPFSRSKTFHHPEETLIHPAVPPAQSPDWLSVAVDAAHDRLCRARLWGLASVPKHCVSHVHLWGHVPGCIPAVLSPSPHGDNLHLSCAAMGLEVASPWAAVVSVPNLASPTLLGRLCGQAVDPDLIPSPQASRFSPPLRAVIPHGRGCGPGRDGCLRVLSPNSEFPSEQNSLQSLAGGSFACVDTDPVQLWKLEAG